MLSKLGLAPLSEQTSSWEFSSSPSSPLPAEIPLDGHCVVMYYNIVENKGRGSIAVNVTLDRLIGLMERGMTTTSTQWKRQLREHVRQGRWVVLFIYDWPQGSPVVEHIVRQVCIYR